MFHVLKQDGQSKVAQGLQPIGAFEVLLVFCHGRGWSMAFLSFYCFGLVAFQVICNTRDSETVLSHFQVSMFLVSPLRPDIPRVAGGTMLPTCLTGLPVTSTHELFNSQAQDCYLPLVAPRVSETCRLRVSFPTWSCIVDGRIHSGQAITS
jgi:hypothetical protein